MAYYLSSLVRSVVSGRSVLDTFGFTVTDLIHETPLWKVHSATKKADGSPATVFIFEGDKAKDPAWMLLAKNTFRRVKTIRHPNMLKFLDGVESDTMVVIATEKVQPLSSVSFDLENKFDEALISWGLHQILNAVKFLNEDCSLVHGSLAIPSIYVDPAGEWKLFGFEYLCSLTEDSPLLLTHYSMASHLQKYKPPEVLKAKSWDIEKSCPAWSTDIWYYGCLIYELFNKSFSVIDEIKTKGNIPNAVFTVYKEFMKGEPTARLSPSQVLQKLTAKGEYFTNEFIQASSFLENFALKDTHEKDQFFRKLGDTVSTFPDAYCKYKVLPELTKALEFGVAGSKALTPLLKIGQKLNEEEYETHVVSSVVKLFSSSDRAMRVSLLENLPTYIDNISAKLVNEKIFPQVATGFSDQIPAMRELSIKSMLLFAPKLNSKVMNNDLLRHFAKLQMDEEPGIRTNTTICLGKIAEYMDTATRKRVLAAAFCRAIRDPFPPARSAGLMALLATQAYYDHEEIATKILPQVCMSLVDPDQSAQQQALKTATQFMKTMEKFIKEGPKEASAGADETQKGSGKISQSTLDSWTSWKTISSLAWGSSSTAAAPATGAPDSSKSQPAQQQPQQQPQKPAGSQPSQAQARKTSSATDEDSEPSSPQQTTLITSGRQGSMGKGMSLYAAPKPAAKAASDGWGDDLDDLLAAEITPASTRQPASTGNGWDAMADHDDDSWATSSPSKKTVSKPKSAASSFNAAAKSNDADEWAPLEQKESEEEQRAKYEEARRKQQERKEQRLKARGASSFGTTGKDY